MNIPETLDKVLEIAPRHDVPIGFKGFFISDLHVGVRDEADDFQKNSKLCYDWLETYFQAGYTLFLLGDIYDIWENPDFNRKLLSNWVSNLSNPIINRNLRRKHLPL